MGDVQRNLRTVPLNDLAVTFTEYGLGYFDDETCRLEPIDNPFAAKMLPMSPEWTKKNLAEGEDSVHRHPGIFELFRQLDRSNPPEVLKDLGAGTKQVRLRPR